MGIIAQNITFIYPSDIILNSLNAYSKTKRALKKYYVKRQYRSYNLDLDLDPTFTNLQVVQHVNG